MHNFFAGLAFGVAAFACATTFAPSIAAAAFLGGSVAFGVWNAISALKEKS